MNCLETVLLCYGWNMRLTAVDQREILHSAKLMMMMMMLGLLTIGASAAADTNHVTISDNPRYTLFLSSFFYACIRVKL